MIFGRFNCRVTVVGVEHWRIRAVGPRVKQWELSGGVWGHFVCVDGWIVQVLPDCRRGEKVKHGLGGKEGEKMGERTGVNI